MAEGLNQTAGQVLVAGFHGDSLDERVGRLAGEASLGGVILFRRNIVSPEQTRDLVRDLISRAPAHLPPLVSVDQEGGRVARLGSPVLRLPPMRRLGEIDDAELTRTAAAVLGGQLGAIGFNCDFAPVLDVDTNPDNPVIGDRSFGREPERVAHHGLAFAEGLAASGLLACGKHFPGHGDTELDSHFALPRLTHDRTRLDAVELFPFRKAVGRLPMIMTAHVLFDALDPSRPATLSQPVITGLLRDHMGFDGIIVSDDLEMKAVSDRWGVPEAACLAVEAGCDALLVCSDVEALHAARAALVRRAEGDAAFAARLREAAERFVAARRRHPPSPAGADLSSALTNPESDRVQAELDRRVAGSAAGMPPARGENP